MLDCSSPHRDRQIPVEDRVSISAGGAFKCRRIERHADVTHVLVIEPVHWWSCRLSPELRNEPICEVVHTAAPMLVLAVSPTAPL